MFTDDIKHAAVDRYRRIASAGIQNTPCRESCPTDDPRRRLSREFLQLEAAGMLISESCATPIAAGGTRCEPRGARHAGVPAHVADGGQGYESEDHESGFAARADERRPTSRCRRRGGRGGPGG